MTDSQFWINITSVITNISILIVGIKLVRHLTRMEMKVDLMWGVFARRYGTRVEDGLDIADE